MSKAACPTSTKSFTPIAAHEARVLNVHNAMASTHNSTQNSFVAHRLSRYSYLKIVASPSPATSKPITKQTAIIIASILLLALLPLPLKAITFMPKPFDAYASLGAIASDNSLFTSAQYSQKYVSSYDASCKLDFDILRVAASVRFSDQVTDFQGKVAYCPTVLDYQGNRFDLGLGTIYHARNWQAQFLEQDLLLGIYTRYRYKCFTVDCDIDYLYKWTDIYAVSDAIGYIDNHSLALSTVWSWDLSPRRWSFYCAISSYTNYNYLLFFSPSFSTGGKIALNEYVSLGSEFRAQYIDFFLLSAYMAGFEAKLYLELHLPLNKR